MRRTIIIAVLVVIAAFAAKECSTPGTLGFSLFQSKLVVDSTLVALCLLLYLLGQVASPGRTQGGRGSQTNPRPEVLGFELDKLKSDEESPTKSEVLPPEREATRSHDRQR